MACIIFSSNFLSWFRQKLYNATRVATIRDKDVPTLTRLSHSNTPEPSASHSRASDRSARPHVGLRPVGKSGEPARHQGIGRGGALLVLGTEVGVLLDV